MQVVVRSAAFLSIWRRLPRRVRDILMYQGSAKVVATMQVALLTEDDQIVLVRHTYGPNKAWILPGGLLGRGEQPEHGAAREVWEELGLVPQNCRLLLAERGDWLLTLTYAARTAVKPTLSTEIAEIRCVTADALGDLIERQEAAVPSALPPLLRDLIAQPPGR